MGENSYLNYVGLQYFYNKIMEGSPKSISKIPHGLIALWSGSKVPSGWALCDGTNGTPDLRSKFILGATTLDEVHTTGGSETHTISVEELPPHSHSFGAASLLESTEGGSLFSAGENLIDTSGTGLTNDTGGGEPISIMPPYYILAYIMKLDSGYEDVTSIYKFKGAVNTYNDLVLNYKSGNVIGDTYVTRDTGESFAWNGDEWVSLGLNFEIAIVPIPDSAIDALFS